MRKMMLSILLLLTSALAAQLPNNAFPLASQRLGVAPGQRGTVRLAASSGQVLAAWADLRSGDTRLWVQRLTPNGERIDFTGFEIADLAENGAFTHTVASDGTDYLVAWADPAVHMIKVRRDGNLQHPPDPGLDAREIALVWIGDLYAMFTLSTDGRTVRVTMLDQHGSVIVTPRTVITSQFDMRWLNAALSPAGDEVLVAWSDATDSRIHAHPFPAVALRRGDAVPPGPIAPQTQQNAPHSMTLTQGGNGYLVTWIAPGFERTEVRVRHLDQFGIPDGEPLTVAEYVPGGIIPRVAWNGTHFVVTFSTAGGGLAATRFSNSGARVDNSPITISEPIVTDAAVVSTGNGDTTIAWTRAGSVSAAIYGDVLTSSITLRHAGRNVISQSNPRRSDVDVEWRGDHYLAAWLETSDTSRVVYGRVTSRGAPLDGAGTFLDPDGVVQSPPSLASDGFGAIIAWKRNENPREIRVAYIDANGRATQLFSSTQGAIGAPLAHWNGSQYVVVWATSQLIHAVRFAADGRIIGGPSQVSTASVVEVLDIGWTGDRYVLAMRAEECTAGIAPPVCFGYTLLTLDFTRELNVIGPLTTLGSMRYARDARARIGERNGQVILVWPSTTGTLRAARFTTGGLIDPGGFIVGSATNVSDVIPARAGWTVLAGSQGAWIVGDDRSITRTSSFAFMPQTFDATLEDDGPALLVAYAAGSDVLGRYVLTPRFRGARH